MKVLINTLIADLFLKLYTSVGWIVSYKEQVERALENTLALFMAYEDDKPVGMVRILGDSGMSFYIKGFAVIPKYQGKGIGKLLISEVQNYILSNIDKDWSVSLELISTKEGVKFYKKNGFEERLCEWDEPGMFKMIKNISNLISD